MRKRLLSLDDLCEYYEHRKKSMKFNSEEFGEPIVVQVYGCLNFEDSENDFTAGLTPVRLQACHTERNLNKSTISYDVMKNKLLPSFKNRPILGYIHLVDGVPQFYGHNAHEEGGEIVYDETPVGNIPETNNAELVYDEEKDRYNVMLDGYIYDEYSKAADIVKREGVCPCSVEISIKSMSFSAKDHSLVIEDGYFSGVAILGYDENGNRVQPGMEGSNIKLKDFAKSNNSILNELSDSERSKLIETLENLNKTLSSLNTKSVNTTENSRFFEKGGDTEINMTKFEELLEKYGKTIDDIDFEYNGMTDAELEESFANAFEESENDDGKDPDETDDDNQDGDSTEEPSGDDPENGDTDDSTESKENNSDEDDKEDENFSKSFELSHEDIRTSLYGLLAPIEESLNDCYWIVSVFDDYFIYQSCVGNFYKQGYIHDGDIVAFNGDRQDVFPEFVTESERAELEEMRKNYSSISEKLAAYEEAESIADKMTVFEDDAYANYLDTNEFKSLMNVEVVKKFTKEELSEKADAALGKVVKTTKMFSVDAGKNPGKETKTSFVAFSRQERNTSFLDGLLNQK